MLDVHRKRSYRHIGRTKSVRPCQRLADRRQWLNNGVLRWFFSRPSPHRPTL
ncbi:hypothetical protein HMPREF9570_01682 [Cutibacterium acnes HL043PA1]|nr:hypothetical protein HMPREF9570_01682 [Cutibacterium acnes HL043PA1]